MIGQINMSLTNRPLCIRVMDAGFFSLMAGMVLGVFLIGKASNHPTLGDVDVGALAAAIPFGALISLCLSLAISSVFEPYSRHARDLRNWTHHWVDQYSMAFAECIWYLQTRTAYWLAYGLWVARYVGWYMRHRITR